MASSFSQQPSGPRIPGESIESSMRSYCQNVGACVAKTPGKHCARCTAATPECRARKSAAVKAALADPDIMARKVALCRRIAADPEITARKSAAMRKTHARPDVRERHRAGCKQAMTRRMEDPVEREKLREQGRQVGRFNIVHANSPEAKAKRGLSIRARHLDWCPPEHWDFNQQLKRKGYLLAERQRIILTGAIEKPETGAETVRRIANELLAKHHREVASRY